MHIMLRFMERANYPVHRQVNRVYFSLRYALSRARIGVYCLWRGYPPGKIFLAVSSQDLRLTEFDENGHRDISSRNIYRILGRVKDGDWDLNRTSIERYHIYRALQQHFYEGIDLAQTAYFDDGSGTQRYHGTGIWHRMSAANYAKEVERNTRLYQSLKQHGYRPQRELGGLNILDEIRVKIGRDGEFLWEDSIHRFVIARLLGLERVTVVVTVRHLHWVRLKQQLIREARQHGRAGPAGVGRSFEHPDLDGIPYSEAGNATLQRHLEKHVHLPKNRIQERNSITPG